MMGLCRKQAELKANHLDALEDLEAASAKRIAESAKRIAQITDETRVRKRALKADYRKAQMELEFAKQQLRTDWILEHGEPEDDTNASRIARQMA